MSNNLTVLVVGAGVIAREYVKVLIAQKANPIVVTRGKEKASRLKSLYPHINIISGGLDSFLSSSECPQYAIVATPIENLADCTKSLIKNGCKHIMVEKPLTLSIVEAKEISRLSEENQCNVVIAFNRRNYLSVSKAKELIESDGGVSSFHFDFSEAIFKINPDNYGDHIPEYWGIVNSSHVVDTAFYLSGNPKWMESRQYGNGVSWHPAGSIFTGIGETLGGVPFTYHANWGTPGRWNIEIMTTKRKLMFSPMERLRQQLINTFLVEEVPLDYSLDNNYKPGFYIQTEQFINNQTDNLKNVNEFCSTSELLYKIFGYKEI